MDYFCTQNEHSSRDHSLKRCNNQVNSIESKQHAVSSIAQQEEEERISYLKHAFKMQGQIKQILEGTKERKSVHHQGDTCSEIDRIEEQSRESSLDESSKTTQSEKPKNVRSQSQDVNYQIKEQRQLLNSQHQSSINKSGLLNPKRKIKNDSFNQQARNRDYEMKKNTQDNNSMKPKNGQLSSYEFVLSMKFNGKQLKRNATLECPKDHSSFIPSQIAENYSSNHNSSNNTMQQESIPSSQILIQNFSSNSMTTTPQPKKSLKESQNISKNEEQINKQNIAYFNEQSKFLSCHTHQSKSVDVGSYSAFPLNTADEETQNFEIDKQSILSEQQQKQRKSCLKNSSNFKQKIQSFALSSRNSAEWSVPISYEFNQLKQSAKTGANFHQSPFPIPSRLKGFSSQESVCQPSQLSLKNKSILTHQNSLSLLSMISPFGQKTTSQQSQQQQLQQQKQQQSISGLQSGYISPSGGNNSISSDYMTINSNGNQTSNQISSASQFQTSKEMLFQQYKSQQKLPKQIVTFDKISLKNQYQKQQQQLQQQQQSKPCLIPFNYFVSSPIYSNLSSKLENNNYTKRVSNHIPKPTNDSLQQSVLLRQQYFMQKEQEKQYESNNNIPPFDTSTNQSNITNYSSAKINKEQFLQRVQSQQQQQQQQQQQMQWKQLQSQQQQNHSQQQQFKQLFQQQQNQLPQQSVQQINKENQSRSLKRFYSQESIQTLGCQQKGEIVDNNKNTANNIYFKLLSNPLISEMISKDQSLISLSYSQPPKSASLLEKNQVLYSEQRSSGQSHSQDISERNKQWLSQKRNLSEQKKKQDTNVRTIQSAQIIKTEEKCKEKNIESNKQSFDNYESHLLIDKSNIPKSPASSFHKSKK